jgi:hypothetical protein
MAELYEIASTIEEIIGLGLLSTRVYLSVYTTSMYDNRLIGTGAGMIGNGLIRQDGNGEAIELLYKYLKKDKN